MIRLLALALGLATMAGAASAQLAPPPIVNRPPPRPSIIPEPSAKRAWDIKVFQIDKAGTLVGDPIEFPCAASGCERNTTLDVTGQPFPFLIVVTFVPRGAYFALQPMQPEITRAIEFEKTYLGPTFLQLRNKERFNTTLRFTLVGPAMRDSEDQPGQMMNNQRSRVFQRKLSPDLILRVALAPAPETKPAPDPAMKPVPDKGAKPAPDQEFKPAN
jgi:hypothetical protein